MKHLLLIVFCLFAVHFTISGQEHRCGTTIDDQLKMEALFGHDHHIDYSSRGNKIYIPIKFQLVANNDGTGAVRYGEILKQLARLNRDYAKWDIVFYFKDNYNFNKVNRGLAYSNPRADETFLATKKDPNAVNVFVVDNIGDSGVGSGIVLGYFSPDNDFLVERIKELTDSTSTLSHEVGHFFNLRHTFFGWEENPYEEAIHGNPYTKQTAPGSNVQAEVMNKSNCNFAADQLCDTPPDYNFGITANGCSFGKIIRDRNLDTIKTMKNNFMSYFNSCAKYEFTQDQVNRMLTNYNSASRAYVRSGYIPNDTKIENALSVINTPLQGEKIETYNSVFFDWEDQGAQYYLLEVYNSQQEYYAYFTTSTEFLVQDLKANKLYFSTVRAFNEGYSDTNSPVRGFRTGTSLTGTEDTKLFSDLSIFPNPVSTAQEIFIDIQVEKSDDLTISLTDLSGKNFLNQSHSILQGDNLIRLSTTSLSGGMYLLQLKTKEGSYTKKIVVY